MKIFISQPMSGKSDEEILREREKAVREIKEEFGPDAEIIDSFFRNYDTHNGCIPLKYLARSIDKLANADAAYFCFGWSDARGCRIEHNCAVAYGIRTLGSER